MIKQKPKIWRIMTSWNLFDFSRSSSTPTRTWPCSKSWARVSVPTWPHGLATSKPKRPTDPRLAWCARYRTHRCSSRPIACSDRHRVWMANGVPRLVIRFWSRSLFKCPSILFDTMASSTTPDSTSLTLPSRSFSTRPALPPPPLPCPTRLRLIIKCHLCSTRPQCISSLLYDLSSLLVHIFIINYYLLNLISFNILFLNYFFLTFWFLFFLLLFLFVYYYSIAWFYLKNVFIFI